MPYSKQERALRLKELLNELHIDHLAKRKPLHFQAAKDVD